MNAQHSVPVKKRPGRIRPKVFQPVQRHSQRVRQGKKILWALALLLLTALIYYSWSNAEQQGVRLVFSGMPKSGEEATSMARPRYQGVDAQNQPFTVIADTATQLDEDTVLLDALNADMTLKDTSWLALTAKEGKYTISNKHLLLTEDVHLFYEGGYEFKTEKALVNLAASTAVSDVPVEGQGPTGTIKANSFRAVERGKILYFNGSVRVTLYP